MRPNESRHPTPLVHLGEREEADFEGVLHPEKIESMFTMDAGFRYQNRFDGSAP